MPSIVGKYQHYKNENIDEFYAAVGVPYIARKMMGLSHPIMEISSEGENMSIQIFSRKNMHHKFKLNEEFEEIMPDGSVLKSTTKILNDHEMETVTIAPNGDITKRFYVFSDEECVIAISVVGSAPQSVLSNWLAAAAEGSVSLLGGSGLLVALFFATATPKV